MNLPERVAWLREVGGLSAAELSLLAGLSRAFVSHVERGLIRRPSYEKAKRIGEVCGVEPEWLFDGGVLPAKKHVRDSVEKARAKSSELVKGAA